MTTCGSDWPYSDVDGGLGEGLDGILLDRHLCPFIDCRRSKALRQNAARTAGGIFFNQGRRPLLEKTDVRHRRPLYSIALIDAASR